MLRNVPVLTHDSPGWCLLTPHFTGEEASRPLPHVVDRQGERGIRTSVCDAGKPRSDKPLAWDFANGKPFRDDG